MSNDERRSMAKGPADESTAVRRELPHPASRGMALFFIALGAAALGVSVLVPFPETVEGKFVLAPITGADPVRAPVSGVIERVVATEGSEVHAGDPLFVIRAGSSAADGPQPPALKHVVTAPFDGMVVDLGVRRGDTLVERGESLCRLSPANTPLRAEIMVPARGVGLVVPGQSVRLLLDSYPYTRFGARTGTLAWIAPLGTEGGFTAMCALHETEVSVRGHAQPLRPGMTGQARIDVGRRTILEYAMEPLRQLKENVAPESK